MQLPERSRATNIFGSFQFNKILKSIDRTATDDFAS